MKMKNTARELVVASCVTLAAAFACHGALSVKFGSAMEVEIDGEVRTFSSGSVWEPPAKVPCIYKMRPVLAAGERTFNIESTVAPQYNYPQYGEGNWVRIALADNERMLRALGCDEADALSDYETTFAGI